MRATAEEGGGDGAACGDGGDHEERARVAVVQCGCGGVSAREVVACCCGGDRRQDGETERSAELPARVQQARRQTGVWMTPGETALTRMPREAYSIASDLVAEATPPFVSAARTDGTLEFA